MIAQTSTGQCGLCGSSTSKRGMTRHLQACLRKTSPKASSRRNKLTNTEVFHLVVEGRYQPEYWMHLQVPVTATLEDVDIFLRVAWLKCCDHMSIFKIQDENYYSHAHEEQDTPSDDEGEEVEFPSFSEEDMQQILSNSDVPDSVKQILKMSQAELQENMDTVVQVLQNMLSEMLDETGKDGEAIALAKSDTGNAGESLQQFFQIDPSMQEGLDEFFLEGTELGILPPSFMGERECMHYELKDLIEKGMTFRHNYDFGSTTELNLRVVSMYEASIGTDDEPVQVLARNDLPTVYCHQCGEPASLVCSYCISQGEGWLCEKCSRKHDCQNEGMEFAEEMKLPIVNSPRVGVCGYEG